MKLRTKLFVALAAALVFQLVQVLVTEHYIRRMAGAAERIDEAVTASECGRAAIDALQAARAAIGEVSRHQRPLQQLQVVDVYTGEAWRQIATLFGVRSAGAELADVRGVIDAQRDEVRRETAACRAAVEAGDAEALEEHGAFADDALGTVYEALSRTAVRLRGAIEAALEEERAIRGLPTFVGFVVFGVSFALLLAYAAFLSRRFVRPILEVAGQVQRIAEGRDLTVVVPVQSGDEIGALAAAINDLADTFRGSLEAVVESARELEAQSVSLRHNCTSIAGVSTGQARLVSELSRSLDAVSGELARTVDGTASARNLAAESRDKTRSSWARMEDVRQAMQEIAEANAAAQKVVAAIDDIAFQTNLLALNAAVEAARAGDAGRGFAVVAEEVRGLARRSAESARSSAAIIERSHERAQRGLGVAESLAATLQEVMASVEQVDGHLRTISDIAGQQVGELRQLNGRLADADVGIQSGAAGAQALAATATETSQCSAGLLELVELFRVGDDDGAGQAPAADAPDDGVRPRAVSRSGTGSRAGTRS